MPVPPAPFDFTKVKKLAWIAKPKGDELKGHPVFLLTMIDDVQYVTKVEQKTGPDVMTSSSTINLLYSIANEVGGGVAGRTMELEEVPAFFAMTHRLNADLDDATRDYIRGYEAFSIGMKPRTERAWKTGGGGWVSGFTTTKVNRSPFLWIIMDAQRGLKDLKGLTEGENVEVPKVFSLLIDLQRDDNLKGLGRIIASDMFVGNNDRFNVAEGRIQNAGNVFFVNLEGGYSIRGLDPLDPNGQNKFHLALEHDPDRRDWLGAKLNDDNFLRQAASGILDSVVWALKSKLPTHQQLRFYFCFKAQEKQAVFEGIKEGREKIRAICERMMRSPHRPAGLQSRMGALGWLNIGMFGPYGSTPGLQPPNAPGPRNQFIGRRGT
jgi:hypothetical protein